MSFHSRANRKLIAVILFTLFYGDFYAANHRLMSRIAVPVILANSVRLQHSIPRNFSAIEVPRIPDETRPPVLNLERAPDIDGPGQPEMKSFRPAGMDNMVDLFSGDFSYNIPLLDVGGYPVNLFYSGGISMEQEASWVGLGWNINPGAVNRNMRGLPDDFNGDEVKKEMNIKNDLSVGVSLNKTLEVFGIPKIKKWTPVSDLTVGVNYNNYRGVGVEIGFNPAVNLAKKNVLDNNCTMDTFTVYSSLPGGANLSLNSQSGLTASPYINFNRLDKGGALSGKASLSYNSRVGLQSLQMSFSENREYGNPTQQFIRAFIPGLGSHFSFAKPSVTPSIRMPMNTFNANLSLRFGKGFRRGTLRGPTIAGYLSISKLDDRQKASKAFGFFHFTDATDKDALMDFNRINDIPYMDANPVIAFPVYTYDVFSISGEGTGGSFRGYRSDIGYVRDQQVKSTNSSFSLGLGLNGTGKFKVDVDFNPVISPTEVGPWLENNFAKQAIPFVTDDQKTSAVYFKNPAEKTIIDQNYFNELGGDNLVRLRMSKTVSGAQLRPQLEVFQPDYKNQLPNEDISSLTTVRQVRDKRSQVITTLTAEEASIAGLQQKIEYYDVNEFPRGDCDLNKHAYERFEPGQSSRTQLRKRHHLSEITVLGGDGMRHVYGIPVYNFEQQDVSFNVSGGSVNSTTGLVTYDGDASSLSNTSGADHFYQREIIPAYAHSFLLSGLLSPDYVDVKGDGITEDDLGNAVKFNYSKILPGEREYVQWRMPYSTSTYQANYSPNLLTDNSDDKGHYSFGKRELWYLNSIESKTMIATFVLEERQDAREAAGEHGGQGTYSGFKLKQINLYSKAAFKASGTSAKPIKTVHFEYDYSLCPNYPANSGNPVNTDEESVGSSSPSNINSGLGKLTLKKIWFSYAGNNQRSYKNPYLFKYGNNVSYDRKGNDRWGNYKDGTRHSNSLPVDEYPFVIQSTTGQAAEIAPWQLNEVILPSGGKIKATYEADDYAYVQNKRAASMFPIAGFGRDDDDSPPFSNNLYSKTGGLKDHFYVYVHALSTLHSNATIAKKQIREAYLADIRQLYMKLYVDVPSDQLGSGQEPIGLYADVVDYGAATNRDYFWIKVAGINENVSQIMEAVLQYAKDNLTSKIYPGYNTRNQSAVRAMANALLGMGTEIVRTVGGFDNVVRHENKFKTVTLAQSYLRLSQPDAKKYGGGYRVKEIRILDQWDKMTEQYLSQFGQQYDYTTTLTIAGEETTISSGVASYEPSIGGEENPFREVMRSRVNRQLAKDQFLMQELPVGEMFYPSASVGYSKVRVSSIKKTEIKNGVSQQAYTFYTTKDFPTVSTYTTFDPASKIKSRPDPFSKIMTHRSKRADYLSQGLLISLNDMNGRMRTQATYADNDLKNPISYTEHFYSTTRKSEKQVQLNNFVSTVNSSNGQVSNSQLIGKDVELMVDFRENISKTYTVSVTDINLDVLRLAPPVIFPLLLRGAYYDETLYRSASLVKIVNTYGILDSIVSIDKGSMVSTKNMLYDGETGEVLVNRTNNEFNSPVYSFNYPAHWAYKGMGGAYQNVGAVYRNLQFWNGKLISGTLPTDHLESGDELLIVSRSINGIPLKPWECTVADGNSINDASSLETNVIWAIDVRKDYPWNNQSQERFIFIDRYGTLFTGKNVTVKILRSGFRNILSASVGSIVSLKNPIQSNALNFSSTPKVVNAGVQQFRELWRIDSLFESKDSLQQSIASVTDTLFNFTPTNTHSLGRTYLNDNPNAGIWNTGVEQAFWARAFSKVGFRSVTKSWQLYDLSAIPSNAFITQANLTLGVYAATTSSWPHKSALKLTNRFSLTRTRHPWYSSSSDNWKNVSIFMQQAQDQLPENSVWNGPFPVNGDGFSSEALIYKNVTEVVRAMKRDESLGYATAFRISLSDNIPKTQTENRIRFKRHDESYSKVNTNLAVKCLTCPTNYAVESYTGFKGVQYYRCAGYDSVQYCSFLFTRKRINPYTTGLLGNWRPLRSKVYFGSRVESTVGTDVSLSKGGIIDNFQPFWLFNANGMDTSNASVWVWNSEITQYNSKGAELENRDPLGRYNSGLYGYNDLLPIAVANNSRYQEIAFDGFEDYSFSTQVCETLCPKGRRVRFQNSSGLILDDTESHSGLSSMKVLPGGTASVEGVVKPQEQQEDIRIRIKLDSTSGSVTHVNGLGTGWRARYYTDLNYTSNYYNGTVPRLAFNWEAGDRSTLGKANSAKWDAYVQAPETGSYQFSLTVLGIAIVKLNGTTIITASSILNPKIFTSSGISLTKGSTYLLEVEYKSFALLEDSRSISLEWKTTGSTFPIATNLLYPPGTQSTASSAVVTQTVWCVRPDSIGARGNYLVDGFNLVQDRKMLISAWIKEGGQDCKCSTYVNNYIRVYCNGTPQTAELKPAGSIIDGWQRLEGEFTVPSTATTYSVQFHNSSGSNAVYFDDVRIQPFNSNMKSFVYHPVNLRLMAELDENNYATFYEYDDDGTLVRVKKETAKGVKTITETRSSLQRIIVD